MFRIVEHIGCGLVNWNGTCVGSRIRRLAAMQGAERNIEQRLEELHTQFHQQRQMTITEELLDIVSDAHGNHDDSATA